MTITDAEKLEYLEKMIQPYEKKNRKKYPIVQFLLGDGKELYEKFWQKKSSSRMAYDLYSWMKDDERIVDFEFEFQLPRLKSGGKGPNMDVYVETKDELIFIESKFTEKANLHYKDNGYLKKAYYENCPYGRSKMELKERYYGNEWANEFSGFCEEWEKTMDSNHWHEGNDWFEPKQETCHLSGILLFLYDKNNKDRIKNKKIRLYNIFWEIKGDVYSEMERQFCEQAQKLLDGIIEKNNPGIEDFKLDAFSVQDMLKVSNKLSTHITFPPDLEEKIIQRNETILNEEKIKSR